MTVSVGFTAARSSPSVKLYGPPGAQPTLRGISGVFDVDNASSVNVTWPAGAVAGDLAIILSHHGYNSNPPTGWNTLDRTTYNGNHGGAVFYKVLDAADITAGGTSYTFGGGWWGGWWGGAVVVAYEDGNDLSLNVIGQEASTGALASWPITYYSEAARSYLLFGSGRDGNVTFGVATPDLTQSLSNRYLAFAELEPSVDGVINETINWAASSSGHYGILVSVTKDAPASDNLYAQSTAISAASEGVRWAVGPLYFEMTLLALSGVAGVGVVNLNQTFGAAVLGTGTNNFIYRSSGAVVLNGSTIATISAFTVGDTIRVAYHPGARLAWFAVNGGSWNNDGTADPATFIGGIDVSAFVGGPAHPACDFSVGGSVVYATFAEADFAYTPPAGYYSVEEVVIDTAIDVSAGIVPILPGDVPDGYMTRGWLPQDNHSRAISFPAGPVKVIGGEVQEDGVGVAGKLVRVYNRRTGDYIGEAITNGSGGFTIPAQDPNLPHFVVAFDDPDYNAKVYDNVMPS